MHPNSDFDFKEWSCPICLSSEEHFVGFRGGAHQRYGQGEETRIVKCRSCSLLYPNPFPIPKNPQTLYGDPAKYFFLHDEEEKIQDYRVLVKNIIKRVQKKDTQLIDVGSGRGELLEAAKREGINGIGLEFSDAMITHASEAYGLTLLKQSIEEFSASHSDSFDIVTLSAVLEHVYDPNSMLASASKLLRPGGLVYIDVPNEPNLLTRLGNLSNLIVGKRGVYNLSPTWSPYHVYGFNRRSMTILLKKHGFAVESMVLKGGTKFPSNGRIVDKVKAFVATQLVHVGNLIRSGNNMTVWARKI